MLDGLLGRGFSSRCKSLIKLTRTRIDEIRRNKDARQRIMRKDIADLLAHGLDINALGRTEDFLAGLNLLLCYDFIEQTCEYILKQLSVMQKQSECPKECREAVSSIMFAAARFSNLPELRDLRDIFQERYGNSLEYFVNQKFVEKLASNPPPMEKKLQLLQEIALEFSIKWDCKGFKQRMATPFPCPQLGPDETWNCGSFPICDDKFKAPSKKGTALPRTDKHVSSKGKGEFVNDRNAIHNGLVGNDLGNKSDLHFFGGQQFIDDINKPLAGREETIPKRDNHENSFRTRREVTVDNEEQLNLKEGSTPEIDRLVPSSRRKRPESVDSGYKLHNDETKIDSGGDNQKLVQQQIATSVRKAQGDMQNSFHNNAIPPPYIKSKDNIIPPPYVKPNDDRYRANIGSVKYSPNGEETPVNSSSHDIEKAVDKSEKMRVELAYHDNDGEVGEPKRRNGHGYEKDRAYYKDVIPLPKPRSVRRKHSKSTSSRHDFGNGEEVKVVKRSSGSRRRENQRRGLKTLFHDEHRDNDEEERVIDKLLLHYSKKPSTNEPEKFRKKSKAHPSYQLNVGESLKNENADEACEPEMIRPPGRSVSLPREQTAPIAPSEVKKVFSRANSFQPDNQARHVHPKLPDYDELAAQFAALRGR